MDELPVPEQQNTAPGWHSLDINEVFSRIDSSRGGLSRDNAATRLQRYGSNHLSPPNNAPPWLALLPNSTMHCPRISYLRNL